MAIANTQQRERASSPLSVTDIRRELSECVLNYNAAMHIAYIDGRSIQQMADILPYIFDDRVTVDWSGYTSAYENQFVTSYIFKDRAFCLSLGRTRSEDRFSSEDEASDFDDEASDFDDDTYRVVRPEEFYNVIHSRLLPFVNFRDADESSDDAYDRSDTNSSDIDG